MLRIAGTPSSALVTFRSSPASRASLNPYVPVRRSAGMTSPTSAVSGVPILPMRAPGDMPAASAATSSCAGRP